MPILRHGPQGHDNLELANLLYRFRAERLDRDEMMYRAKTYMEESMSLAPVVNRWQATLDSKDAKQKFLGLRKLRADLGKEQREFSRILTERIDALTRISVPPEFTNEQTKQLRLHWYKMLEHLYTMVCDPKYFDTRGLSRSFNTQAQEVKNRVLDIAWKRRYKRHTRYASTYHQRVETLLRSLVTIVFDRLSTATIIPWVRDGWWLASICHTLHGLRPAENIELLSYYKDAESFARGVRTTVKPGRYLTKYFKDKVSESVIRDLSARYIAHVKGHTLFFTDLPTAKNTDELQRLWMEIYSYGPQTCMKGHEAVRAYPYPDNGLRLAYFTSDDKPFVAGQNKLVARCITRDQKVSEQLTVKTWLRIYPDDKGPLYQDMQRKLEMAGYKTRGNLNGVKIALYPTGYACQIVLPYLDAGENGQQLVSISLTKDKDRKVVERCLICGDRSMPIGATGSGGVAKITPEMWNACEFEGVAQMSARVACNCCGRMTLMSTSMTATRFQGQICPDCYQEYFREAISHNGSMVVLHRDQTAQNRSDGRYYDRRYLGEYSIAQCQYTYEFFHVSDLVKVYPGGDYMHKKLDFLVPLSSKAAYKYKGMMASRSSTCTTHLGHVISLRDAVEINVAAKKSIIIHVLDGPDTYKEAIEEQLRDTAMDKINYLRVHKGIPLLVKSDLVVKSELAREAE